MAAGISARAGGPRNGLTSGAWLQDEAALMAALRGVLVVGARDGQSEAQRLHQAGALPAAWMLGRLFAPGLVVGASARAPGMIAGPSRMAPCVLGREIAGFGGRQPRDWGASTAGWWQPVSPGWARRPGPCFVGWHGNGLVATARSDAQGRFPTRFFAPICRCRRAGTILVCVPRAVRPCVPWRLLV